MSRIIVYTAIFGTIKDRLRVPASYSEDVEYHAYVDEYIYRTAVKNMSKPEVNGWTLKPPVWHDKSSRRQARQHKVLSHRLYPTTEFTLWIDGCLTPAVDPLLLIDGYLHSKNIATFRHGERSCVYRELEACITLRKDNVQLMREQIAKYKNEGYPYNAGLAETTAVLRKNCPEINELNEAWWEEICNGSVRDQLSFNYVCWRKNIKYGYLSGSRTRSELFSWENHRR